MSAKAFEALATKEFDHICEWRETTDKRLDNHAERLRWLEMKMAAVLVINAILTAAVTAAAVKVFTGGS